MERDLTDWMTFQAAYGGTRAIGQFAFVNINAGPPGTGTAGRALYAAGLTNATTDITSYQPYRDTVYNALQTELRGRAGSAQAGLADTLPETTDQNGNRRRNAPRGRRPASHA